MPSPEWPHIYRVRVSAPEAVVRKFLAVNPLEPQSVTFADGTVSVDLFVPETLYRELASFGLKVEILFDATQRTQERRREVGKGNRFADGLIPVGLGLKTQ